MCTKIVGTKNYMNKKSLPYGGKIITVESCWKCCQRCDSFGNRGVIGKRCGITGMVETGAVQNAIDKERNTVKRSATKEITRNRYGAAK